MLLKADQQRVTALLTETVTLLCKNGLHFKSQFKIEGLIGITLDQEDIFLVNINETVAVEGAAQEDDGANSPPPMEGRPTALSKKRRLRHTPVESTQGLASESSLPSAKPLSVSTPKESYATLHHDNSSTSDHRSRSPMQPASVKSQSEDAGLTRTGSPRPSSSAKASETNASDRVVSFCDVPIKLDYALSSRDPSGSASESHHVSEPASKRPRRHIPSQAVDASLSHDQNSVEPPGFDMPSGSSSCKMEPSDIIEIKEESLSDDEMKESIAGYSSYADYSSATAAYGNSDLDASQMYGETSGFQADAMFQSEMQANAGLRSHEVSSLTCSFSRIIVECFCILRSYTYTTQCYDSEFTSFASHLKNLLEKLFSGEHPQHCHFFTFKFRPVFNSLSE